MARRERVVCLRLPASGLRGVAGSQAVRAVPAAAAAGAGEQGADVRCARRFLVVLPESRLSASKSFLPGWKNLFQSVKQAFAARTVAFLRRTAFSGRRPVAPVRRLGTTGRRLVFSPRCVVVAQRGAVFCRARRVGSSTPRGVAKRGAVAACMPAFFRNFASHNEEMPLCLSRNFPRRLCGRWGGRGPAGCPFKER